MNIPLPQNLVINFSGICQPNPGGVVVYGWIISDGIKNLVYDKGIIINKINATNNYAEYCALGQALRYLVKRETWICELQIIGSSQLVINQVCGKHRCREKHLIRLRDRCLDYLQQIGATIIFKWIPLAQNKEAGKLAWLAYEEHRRQ